MSSFTRSACAFGSLKLASPIYLIHIVIVAHRLLWSSMVLNLMPSSYFLLVVSFGVRRSLITKILITKLSPSEFDSSAFIAMCAIIAICVVRPYTRTVKCVLGMRIKHLVNSSNTNSDRTKKLLTLQIAL